MLNIIAAGSMVAALVAPVAAPDAAPQAAVLEKVTAAVASVNGSGCPGGTGSVAVTGGGTTLDVRSPAYFAWAGGEAAPTDFRKNCQISLKVTKPEGLTFAVYQVSSSGFAYLAEGASGVVRENLYFAGGSQTAAFSKTFTGPMARTWENDSTTDLPSLVFSPCGVDRNLNVNTELRAMLGTAGADSNNLIIRDGGTKLRLIWVQCSSLD